jgi:hypothetical protein
VINASAIESALIGKLASDPELAGLLPDGVYWDLARQGSTRFAVVSLSTSRGLSEINDGETLRAFVYVVKAVALGPDADPIVAADARIHALLDRGSLDLTAAGCSLMIMRWLDRIRYTETAAADTWQHRGGRYEVTVTPEL